MKFMIMATAITVWMWVVETLYSWLQARQRRDWRDYIVIFLVVYIACGLGKCYGTECNLRHPVIDENTTDEIEHYHPRYRAYYKVTADEMEHTASLACKFVPPNTPPEYVNEDGTPSYLVWNKVQSCNQKLAKKSYDLHCEKSNYYFYEANNASIFLPNTEVGHNIRNAFVLLMTVFPADGASKTITAVCTSIMLYGLDVFEAYEDVLFNLQMQQWHYNCAQLFRKHMQQQGWM